MKNITWSRRCGPKEVVRGHCGGIDNRVIVGWKRCLADFVVEINGVIGTITSYSRRR